MPDIVLEVEVLKIDMAAAPSAIRPSTGIYLYWRFYYFI